MACYHDITATHHSYASIHTHTITYNSLEEGSMIIGNEYVLLLSQQTLPTYYRTLRGRDQRKSAL